MYRQCPCLRGAFVNCARDGFYKSHIALVILEADPHGDELAGCKGTGNIQRRQSGRRRGLKSLGDALGSTAADNEVIGERHFGQRDCRWRIAPDLPVSVTVDFAKFTNGKLPHQRQKRLTFWKVNAVRGYSFVECNYSFHWGAPRSKCQWRQYLSMQYDMQILFIYAVFLVENPR